MKNGIADMFNGLLASLKLRFFPTANLVAAYELIDRAEQRDRTFLSDTKIQDGKRRIYRELVRRGDESLV
jgi:hypothetical protein